MLHDLPVININVNGMPYRLYVAHNASAKSRGLSGVAHLDEDEGMIFPYSNDKPRTFQFRDTLMPLTIYFIDSSGKVVQKSSAKAGQLRKITCPTPCRWVIEIFDKDN